MVLEKKNFQKQVKILGVLFLVSFGLNLGFLVRIVTTQSLSKKKFSPEKKIAPTHGEYVTKLFEKSFASLTEELLVEDPLEDGYRKRDLALSVLASVHFFDVEKALEREVKKYPATFRHVDGGERFSLPFFPDISKEEFAKLYSFATKEKWPITLEGIFHRIKKASQTEQKELKELIAQLLFSKEWQYVRSAFLEFFPGLDQKVLLQFVRRFAFDDFMTFYRNVYHHHEIRQEICRDFLLSHISEASPLIIHWIQKEEGFLLHQLSDSDLVTLMSTCNEAHPVIKSFLLSVLTSMRREFVRMSAAERLYFFEGIERTTIDLQEALDHFCFSPMKKNSLSKAPDHHESSRRYIVQSGDSLWKIAKKFHISIQELKESNAIGSDCLKPGQELMIPSDQH